MEKVRVIFFINDLAMGGKERQFVEIVKYMHLNNKIECCVVLLNDIINYDELFNLNIQINVLGPKTDTKIIKIIRLNKIIKDFNPDVIHNFINICSMFSIFLKSFNKSYRVIDNSVRSFQRPGQYNSSKLIKDQISFFFSDKIVGNSNAGIESYNAPQNKSKVIYNGYDFSRNNNLIDKSTIREKFNVKTKYVVGKVARFTNEKDFDFFFLTAFLSNSRKLDITFMAVGDGPNLIDYQRKVRDSNCSNVIFTGMQSDVESIINNFDIGLLLTDTIKHGEGISNSIIEYMALKIPVIATCDNGTSEIINNNINGFLIKNRNNSELLSLIEKLLNDQILYNDISNAARKTIETNFNMINVGTSFFKLYKEIQ